MLVRKSEAAPRIGAEPQQKQSVPEPIDLRRAVTTLAIPHRQIDDAQVQPRGAE